MEFSLSLMIETLITSFGIAVLFKDFYVLILF